MDADVSSFSRIFARLTGVAPFPWQSALFARLISDRPDNIPQACLLPTGLGKTSVIAVWLIALAHRPERLPRRLVYVVNRRTVVDQTTVEVERYRERLKASGLHEALEQLCAFKAADWDDKDPFVPLAISTLRGQFADNRAWSADPARPAVVIGTVDMIGSRLLFSGYNVGYKGRPLHAGFLGQDSLIVHDEAHLEPAFQKLLQRIETEQGSCHEFRPLRVMELTATPCKREETKADSLFTLTDEEQEIPAKLPAMPTEPVHVVWRRQAATKRMELHENEDDKKLAEAMVEVAAGFVGSGRAVLVFARRVEDVEKIVAGLKKRKATVQNLTGTMRGLERDRMADPKSGCPIFARFLRPDLDAKETVYLVCTSAGEVGVNLSADHLVCDLSTFESMAQRFGRVNRFGDRDDTEIHVVHPAEFDVGNEIELRRQRTLALLQSLGGDASPAALGRLDAEERQAAYAPPPEMLEATDILFDSWSLTSLRELPGRPPVEPYLHGVQEQELPETAVAWRQEVSILHDKDVRDRFPAEEIRKLLDDYPLKPHELLRDLSNRVFERLKKLASLPETQADTPLWLIANDDKVELSTLGQLLRAGKEQLFGKTLVLAPAAGGLDGGLMSATPFDPERKHEYDVADDLHDEKGSQRRRRDWGGSDLVEDYDWWLVRSIDTKPNLEDQGEEFDSGETPRRYWNFFERAREADAEGSEAVACEVLWDDHTRDVADRIDQIAAALPHLRSFARMFRLAGEYHDLGKQRTVWQRSIGNTNRDKMLAKSEGGRVLALDLARDYRHEFGSLADLLREGSEFDLSELSDDERELLLHVIATHHGRGRPHFPAAEAFDPLPAGIDAAAIAADVARRFARLQRQYGRWGLAYLESILRAADWSASARPTPREVGATQ